jgi:hypothetical protein
MSAPSCHATDPGTHGGAERAPEAPTDQGTGTGTEHPEKAPTPLLAFVLRGLGPVEAPCQGCVGSPPSLDRFPAHALDIAEVERAGLESTASQLPGEASVHVLSEPLLVLVREPAPEPAHPYRGSPHVGDPPGVIFCEVSERSLGRLPGEVPSVEVLASGIDPALELAGPLFTSSTALIELPFQHSESSTSHDFYSV